MTRLWLQACPLCLCGDIDDARTLDEAVHLARIQLDLIAEGQDGTEEYTAADMKAIKSWIKDMMVVLLKEAGAEHRKTGWWLDGVWLAPANEPRAALEAIRG